MGLQTSRVSTLFRCAGVVKIWKIIPLYCRRQNYYYGSVINYFHFIVFVPYVLDIILGCGISLHLHDTCLHFLEAEIQTVVRNYGNWDFAESWIFVCLASLACTSSTKQLTMTLALVIFYMIFILLLGISQQSTRRH